MTIRNEHPCAIVQGEVSRTYRAAVGPRRSAGFTLVEALVSTTIVSIAGAALLLGVQTSTRATDETVEQTIAIGLAKQLMDEIAGQRYHGDGLTAYQTPLGPSNFETAGNGRERFDDIDDYANFVSIPAADRWGLEVGQGDGEGGTRHPNLQVSKTFFDNWSQVVEVYYVNESDPSQKMPGTLTSNMRGVTVRILHRDDSGSMREVANLRRVFAYLPPPT